MSGRRHASASHSLQLIPWHLGNVRDITLNAARAARDLRVFLAEDPADTRRQFERELGVDCRGKELLKIPRLDDPGFVDDVVARLRAEDVGLICSGGVPCFIDPGDWLVKRLRARRVAICALPGASILSTVLSLSGIDWCGVHNRGTFVYLSTAHRPSLNKVFLEAVGRRDEPVVLLLAVRQLEECLQAMRPIVGKRLVSAFFDLAKVPKDKYPYADRVLTMGCAAWSRQLSKLPWDRISDVALMIHPAGA